MRKENLECFGKLSNTGKCPHCRYMESCRFATEDFKRQQEENQRWKSACEFDEETAPESTPPELPVEIEPGRQFSHDEVIALSAFLLRIGSNRKLGRILEAKLMGAGSFSEIAKKEGVSRQAIHKRIGKELASVFGFKSRRLTDSRLLSLSPEEFTLLKRSREGYDEKEIQEEMKIDNKTVFNKLREDLNWKLTRPT